jgi:hypothetical protein
LLTAAQGLDVQFQDSERVGSRTVRVPSWLAAESRRDDAGGGRNCQRIFELTALEYGHLVFGGDGGEVEESCVRGVAAGSGGENGDTRVWNVEIMVIRKLRLAAMMSRQEKKGGRGKFGSERRRRG